MASPLARLHAWSPFGPIFGKELRVTSRRKRTYALRFFYLATLFLLLLLFHLSSRESNALSVVRRAQHSAEIGEVFFIVFSFFTLCSMAAVGPVLTASAINAERLHKTLGVLLMTPITAWQIVCGKLFSRLLIAFTLLALSLPVLAVVRLLGGVEAEQLVASLSISLATVVAGAALGLFLSTLMDRAFAVILFSYTFFFILWAFFPFIFMLLMFQGARGGPPPSFLTLIYLTNPFYAMGSIISPAGATFVGATWYSFVAVHLGFAALLLILSGLILRRLARRQIEGASAAPVFPPPPLVAASASDAAEPPPVPVMRPRRVPPQREVTGNPVLWRELRRPLSAKRWHSIVTTVVTLGALAAVYVLLATSSDYNSRSLIGHYETQMGFALVFCGLLTLLACVISSTAISQEKESDTWILLLVTPLSPLQIVGGKLLGLLRRLLWPAGIIVVHFIAFWLCGVLSGAATWVILWLIFTTTPLFIATGLYFSLRFRSTNFATVANLLFLVLLYGGVPLVVGILGALLANSDSAAEVVGLYAPYPYLGEVVDAFGDPNRVARHSAWVAAIGNVNAASFFACAVLNGLAHLAVTATLLLWTIWRFNAIVGRAEQWSRLPHSVTQQSRRA